jgi:hypothetical protein
VALSARMPAIGTGGLAATQIRRKKTRPPGSALVLARRGMRLCVAPMCLALGVTCKRRGEPRRLQAAAGKVDTWLRGGTMSTMTSATTALMREHKAPPKHAPDQPCSALRQASCGACRRIF